MRDDLRIGHLQCCRRVGGKVHSQTHKVLRGLLQEDRALAGLLRLLVFRARGGDLRYATFEQNAVQREVHGHERTRDGERHGQFRHGSLRVRDIERRARHGDAVDDIDVEAHCRDGHCAAQDGLPWRLHDGDAILRRAGKVRRRDGRDDRGEHEDREDEGRGAHGCRTCVVAQGLL